MRQKSGADRDEVRRYETKSEEKKMREAGKGRRIKKDETGMKRQSIGGKRPLQRVIRV